MAKNCPSSKSEGQGNSAETEFEPGAMAKAPQNELPGKKAQQIIQKFKQQ